MTTLSGDRIMLREYLPSDSEEINRWRVDEKTTRWMGPKFRKTGTLHDVRERLKELSMNPPADGLFYAIADKGSSRYIGGIDLTSIDWIAGNAVLSLVVGAETDRNHGYGGEAVDLLLGYAFRNMGLHRVTLNVCEQNEAAVRCYIRNGFQVEGRRRDEVFLNGTYYDLIQMGILQSEYHN